MFFSLFSDGEFVDPPRRCPTYCCHCPSGGGCCGCSCCCWLVLLAIVIILLSLVGIGTLIYQGVLHREVAMWATEPPPPWMAVEESEDYAVSTHPPHPNSTIDFDAMLAKMGD